MNKAAWKKMTIWGLNPYFSSSQEKGHLQDYFDKKEFLTENNERIKRLGNIACQSFKVSSILFYINAAIFVILFIYSKIAL
ncbi:hypothetical protein [Zooshikella sp. RANM57]|uniref:hypothetical protein n=1 Tax=Zooshikella sp. RANM57 TaxID=3425863 RepID=UPI003D6F98BD